MALEVFELEFRSWQPIVANSSYSFPVAFSAPRAAFAASAVNFVYVSPRASAGAGDHVLPEDAFLHLACALESLSETIEQRGQTPEQVVLVEGLVDAMVETNSKRLE